MIVKLDKSIIDSLDNDECDKKLLFIAGLANLRVSRKIELIAERSVFNTLTEKFAKKLGEINTNIFKTISSRMTTGYEVINNVKYYIKIISSQNYEKERERNIFYIDIDSDNLVDTIDIKLVCENLLDCKFYEFIGNYYIYHNRKYQSRIYLDHNSGGGATMHQVLKGENDKRSYSLCISDTDIKYKGGSIGMTYEWLIKLFNSCEGSLLRNEYSMLIDTGVREMENLIPLQFIDCNLEGTDDEYKKSCNLYTQLKEKDAWKYFDLKNGFNPDNMKINEKNYWKDILVTDKIERIVGIKGNAKLSITKLYEKKDYQFELEEGLKIEWDRIGEVVADWGYASSDRIL